LCCETCRTSQSEHSPILEVIHSVDASALGVSTEGIAQIARGSTVMSPEDFKRVVSLLPGEFAISSALDRCAEHLRGGSTVNPGDLEKLSVILCELLVITQMLPESDPVPIPAVPFLTQGMNTTLIGPGQMNPISNASMPLHVDFLSLEQSWSKDHGGPTFDQLRRAYVADACCPTPK
jgi:hypothetical protein